MTWSKNNQACVSTWFALRTLEQTRRTFATAARQRMADLAFFNPDVSTASRRGTATALARQLHNVFVNYDRARHEQRVTAPAAVRAMVAVLTEAGRTMEELASAVDDSFLFLGEPGRE